MIAINNTASCLPWQFYEEQLLHSCVTFLSSRETYLLFSFWFINFAPHDNARLAFSLLNNIAYSSPSPIVLAHDYKRNLATFSCREYYWRSVDRGWVYPDSEPDGEEIEHFSDTAVAYRRRIGITLACIYMYIFDPKPIPVAREYLMQNIRIELVRLRCYFQKLQYS